MRVFKNWTFLSSLNPYIYIYLLKGRNATFDILRTPKNTHINALCFIALCHYKFLTALDFLWWHILFCLSEQYECSWFLSFWVGLGRSLLNRAGSEYYECCWLLAANCVITLVPVGWHVQNRQMVIIKNFKYFHRLSPLGRVVIESPCLSVCLSVCIFVTKVVIVDNVSGLFSFFIK